MQLVILNWNLGGSEVGGKWQNFHMDCKLLYLILNVLMLIIVLCLYKNILVPRKYILKYLGAKKYDAL